MPWLVLFLQSEVAALEIMAGSPRTGLAAGGLAAALGSVTLGTPTTSKASSAPASASAAAGGISDAPGPADSGPEAAESMGGSFFENLASSEIYKSTKVIFRIAP